MDPDRLRPFERVVVRLADEGMSSSEIGWRFRRSPGHIERVLHLSRLPRARAPRVPADPNELRAVERAVLRARAGGAPLTEVASRLRRSPGYVAQVEAIANYKRGGGIG